MLWIGMTGGIATGKSQVSQILTKYKIPVVDADLLAREVVAKGSEVLTQISQAFGREFLQPDGSLDRKALGQLIFTDGSAREKLEKITHPAIQQLRNLRKKELEAQGHKMAFYDVPLLFEKKMQGEFDKVVLIYCQPSLQLERLMERDKLSEKEALARIQTQLPIESKRSLADIVLTNDSSLEMLEEKVKKVLDHLNSSTKKN